MLCLLSMWNTKKKVDDFTTRFILWCKNIGKNTSPKCHMGHSLSKSCWASLFRVIFREAGWQRLFFPLAVKAALRWLWPVALSVGLAWLSGLMQQFKEPEQEDSSANMLWWMRLPSRQHMEDRDMLHGRMRGAIHAHQKYTAALAIKQDDWRDKTLCVSLQYNWLC